MIDIFLCPFIPTKKKDILSIATENSKDFFFLAAVMEMLKHRVLEASSQLVAKTKNKMKQFCNALLFKDVSFQGCPPIQRYLNDKSSRSRRWEASVPGSL